MHLVLPLPIEPSGDPRLAHLIGRRVRFHPTESQVLVRQGTIILVARTSANSDESTVLVRVEDLAPPPLGTPMREVHHPNPEGAPSMRRMQQGFPPQMPGPQ